MKQQFLRALFTLTACSALLSGCAQGGDEGSGTLGFGGAGPGGAGTGGTSTGGSSIVGSTGGNVQGTGGAATGGTTTGGTSTGGASAGGTANGGDGPWPLADLPAASATVVYLSDLKEKGAVAFDDFGSPARPGNVIGKDVSLAGNPLVIDGIQYTKGIECRAFTQIWYTLGGQYSRLVADTGLDYIENSTRTGFEVKLDGALVYDTGNVDKSDVKHVDIDVKGVNEIEIFTRTDAYDSVDNDFGIWGGARLIK